MNRVGLISVLFQTDRMVGAVADTEVDGRTVHLGTPLGDRVIQWSLRLAR